MDNHTILEHMLDYTWREEEECAVVLLGCWDVVRKQYDPFVEQGQYWKHFEFVYYCLHNLW